MIVFDASALVEIVCENEDGLALQQLILKDEKSISCDLVRAELASVFRKLSRTEHLQPDEAERYFEEALALVDEFHSIGELQTEAFRESIRLNHSTYDLFYFVLARRTGATLVTLDRKLMKLCEENGVNCIQEIAF